VHAVSGLMKMFFRELNPPLMTFDLYGDFMSAAGCVMSDIKALIAQLPAENKMCVLSFSAFSCVRAPYADYSLCCCRLSSRSLLAYLLHFLYDVSQCGDVNKMRPMNLAIVFSPNLFRSNRSAFEVLANSRYNSHTAHTQTLPARRLCGSA
jgi:hypothetical protein